MSKAKDHAELIKTTIEKIKEVVQKMVEIYAKTFRVNFSLESRNVQATAAAPQECIGIYETLLLHVCALHRLEPNWTYDDYTIMMQVYHGTTPIQSSESKSTSHTGKSESFYEWVKFDSW